MSSAPPHLDGETSQFSAFATFDIDGGAGQLSYNPSSEIRPDTKNITWQQEFMKWGVKADIKNVVQIQHDGVAACLLVFHFAFSLESASGLGRVSDAKINVKVETSTDQNETTAEHESTTTAPSAANTQRDAGQDTILDKIWRAFGLRQEPAAPASTRPPSHYPHFAVLCPKYLYGEQSLASISDGISATAGLDYANVSAMRSVDRDQVYMIRARGQRWLNQETGSMSIARWVISENGSQGSSIPTDFSCAVLCQHDQKPLQLSVEVKMRTKTGLSLFGRPWSPLKPVVISPDTRFGTYRLSSQVEDMSVEEWRGLCPANWSDGNEKCIWIDQ